MEAFDPETWEFDTSKVSIVLVLGCSRESAMRTFVEARRPHSYLELGGAFQRPAVSAIARQFASGTEIVACNVGAQPVHWDELLPIRTLDSQFGNTRVLLLGADSFEDVHESVRRNVDAIVVTPSIRHNNCTIRHFTSIVVPEGAPPPHYRRLVLANGHAMHWDKTP